MSDGITVGAALQNLMKAKAQEGKFELCTSHHLYPLLKSALGIEKTPFKKKTFSDSKDKWLKKRKKEIAKSQ